MIKLEALESFTLERFGEIKNIERAGKDAKGFINKNDKFECEKDLANYLLGDNPLKRPVVKVIEVEPKIIIDEEKIVKKVFEEQKPNKKKKSSKKVK